MGSGGAKKTNEMLGQQTQRANALADVAGQRSETSYNAGRGDIDWARGELKGLYGSLGQGGGGGGGGGYTPKKWEDETEDFWRKLMNEGAYDETTRGAMESSATAPISGMAEMLRRGLQTAAAGAGTGGGYASGLGQLFHDQAFAASEANKSAFADIQKLVAESKEKGATGLEDILVKKRAFEAAERARAAAAAGAAASRGAADLATKRSMINQILGLEGNKDLAYMDRDLAALGQATNTVTSRRNETPLWQQALGSVVPSAAGAAMGAFTGGGGGGKKKGGGGGVYDSSGNYVGE